VREQIGSTVVLSRIDFDKVTTIEQIDGGRSMLRIGLVIGSPLGLHSSAQGKLVLAFGRSDLMEREIAAGLTPRTKATIVDAKRLRREVATIQAQGWAVAPNETMTGLNALAAPGPARIAIVKEAAQQISASLTRGS
jgi:IclR family KDG regulon transcriptional repressor